MKIKIGQYQIRDWVLSDSTALVKYANNSKIAANLRDRFPNPYTLSDAESFLSQVLMNEPRTVFAIASQNEAIGCIGLEIGQDIHRLTAELGYWLAEPYWGRGIITSAVLEITNYGFKEFGLNRIFAEPYSSNLASHHVLKKAAFELEGVLHANAVKNGKILDQHMYAITRKE